jgi:hypothetical protein
MQGFGTDMYDFSNDGFKLTDYNQTDDGSYNIIVLLYKMHDYSVFDYRVSTSSAHSCGIAG